MERWIAAAASINQPTGDVTEVTGAHEGTMCIAVGAQNKGAGGAHSVVVQLGENVSVIVAAVLRLWAARRVYAGMCECD